MKTLKNSTVYILIVTSLALIFTYFLPLWSIDLWAPQYPEGLSMQIWLNKLSGDVDIINGLNHYIGMAHIKEEMFPEFKILPSIVAFFILFGLITAILKSRKMLVAYLLLFVFGGMIALYDFWKWGYEYGHNLSPDAAIKVPGMAYQPPLIGYKELLNFGAYSVPAAGGWVFVTAGIIVCFLVYFEFLRKQKVTKALKVNPVLIFILTTSLFACNVEIEQIQYGKAICNFCKMTILDKKYAAEFVTDKGKAFVFDDVKCMISYMKIDDIKQNSLAYLVVNEFNNPGKLIDARKAFFASGNDIHSPMGGDLAAFLNKDTFQKSQNISESKNWNFIYSKF